MRFGGICHHAKYSCASLLPTSEGKPTLRRVCACRRVRCSLSLWALASASCCAALTGSPSAGRSTCVCRAARRAVSVFEVLVSSDAPLLLWWLLTSKGKGSARDESEASSSRAQFRLNAAFSCTGAYRRVSISMA
eukprot:1150502-Pelagomonas_calceolata.AAC.8